MLGFKLLHRMVFFELAKVFLLSLTGLTSLLLLAGLVAEATQHGLGPAQILGAIPLLLPNMLPYTLPTTTLFATCIVYGRLAADNEILALKSAGVHIGHIIWPALLLGVAAAATTATLFVDVIPSTHHQMRTQFLDNVEEYLYSILRKDGCLKHPKIGYEIHVRSVDGDILRDAIFKRRDAKTGLFDIIAHAEHAKLRVDMANKLIYVHMRECNVIDHSGLDGGKLADDKAWPIDLPAEFETAEKYRATDMNWRELKDFRDRWLDDLRRTEAQIAARESQANSTRPPEWLANHVKNLKGKANMLKGMIAGVDAEYHMRPALALGCLCFVLVGCPVGIWFSKSDYLSAFITCFLPIIVLYYPLMLSGINLAKSRQLPPGVAIWAANGLMLIIAVTLFRRLARN